MEGKPLKAGTVVFTPERGRAAFGIIGSNGEYALYTYGDNDGAIVGLHRLAILAGGGDGAGANPAAEVETPMSSAIPDRYAAAATSGLTFEVLPGQENVANFDLRSR